MDVIIFVVGCWLLVVGFCYGPLWDSVKIIANANANAYTYAYAKPRLYKIHYKSQKY